MANAQPLKNKIITIIREKESFLLFKTFPILKFKEV